MTASNHDSVFAEIVLDTTLAELEAEELDGHVDQAICNIKPCADPRHRIAPVNQKFLITSTKVDDEMDLAHLQIENVSFLLSFWAGNMEVALLACEGWVKDHSLTFEIIKEDARTSFSVINEKQRPQPRIFTSKDSFINHYQKSETSVRWAFAVDFAEQIPCFVHPELQYKLNTKRWLGVNSLRSANDRFIDPDCVCSKHNTKDGLWYCGADCKTCEEEVEKSVSRLKDKLQNANMPYVLKVTQALGSVGTWLVRNEKEREKTIEQIIKIQAEGLSRVTAENAHIYPASLVLSDMLPGGTNALNFYIRRDASIKFLGACTQLSTRTEGGRQHTALFWDQQEKLEAKFKNTLVEIGQVLHEQGYSGPCGADIMETEDGTQYVIDLNVRTSTSTILGCLRGHCQSRNFNVCAVYECVLLKLSRDNMATEFRKELQEGRLILMGTTRLGKKNVWAYPMVIAGEDTKTMEELGRRVLNFEAGGDNAGDAGGA